MNIMQRILGGVSVGGFGITGLDLRSRVPWSPVSPLTREAARLAVVLTGELNSVDTVAPRLTRSSFRPEFIGQEVTVMNNAATTPCRSSDLARTRSTASRRPPVSLRPPASSRSTEAVDRNRCRVVPDLERLRSRLRCPGPMIPRSLRESSMMQVRFPCWGHEADRSAGPGRGDQFRAQPAAVHLRRGGNRVSIARLAAQP
jgi:hypothetical protein